MQYLTQSVRSELTMRVATLPFLQPFPYEIRMIGKLLQIVSNPIKGLTNFISARRLIITFDELHNALYYDLQPSPRRNWPVLEDHYPMASYLKSPLKAGCKSYCDKMFCLSQLCLTRMLKNSYFPASRTISIPVGQSDRHHILKLPKVRNFRICFLLDFDSLFSNSKWIDYHVRNTISPIA